MTNSSLILERNDLDSLLNALISGGYEVVGPTVSEGAIVYGAVSSSSDFPIGLTDIQDGACYRLEKRNDQAVFGFTVGPHSWKKYLHPPVRKLWTGKINQEDMEFIPEPPPSKPFAFIGVRSCEIHAMEIQDRVFMYDTYVDEDYKARRESGFVVAVQCAQAGNTCFCVSMNTGPRADAGFDIALTEIIEKDRHFFLVETGTDKGAALLRTLNTRPAEKTEIQQGDETMRRASDEMGRKLDTIGVKELLQQNPEHSRWDSIAERCLSCANCTMVCPTCFCSNVEDVTDLTGEHTERWQKWDSCFTMDFSYLHGGSVRASTKAQYRQWLTHKLSSWVDQFGSSGCVGCGRCVTWCPVGIDLTEEVRFIRENPEST